MARLEIKDYSSRPSWGVPWKLAGVVVIIGGIWAYVWYQYEQYFPKPSLITETARRPAPRRSTDAMAGLVDKLNLTPDQKKQLEAAQKTTTSPAVLRRELTKMLSPDQKITLEAIRAEQVAARTLQKEKNAQRKNRLLPGTDAEVARKGEEMIRQQREQRLKASRGDKGTTAAK